MLYTYTAIFKLALLVLSIAVAISNTTATGRRGYRGEVGDSNDNSNNNNRYDIENERSYGARPRLEPAMIRINGRTEVIDLQSPGVTGAGARTGARAGSGSMLRPAEDIISLELISGPPNFGFFLTSRTDKRFVSPTVNRIQPSVGDPYAFEAEEEDSSEYIPSSSLSSASSVTAKENAQILLHAADRLFYYTLDDPDDQVVTVFQNTKGSVRFNIMDYTTSREPSTWFPTLTRNDIRVAKWEFPRRQDVLRLAVAQAPRGRRSRCQVTIIGAWIDDVRIGKPLRYPKTGVGGIVCFR